MKYLYKQLITLDVCINFVACPTIYPNRFQVIRIPISAQLMGEPESAIIDAIRSAFVLEPQAEVTLEYAGVWDNTVDHYDTMPHPFESGKRIKVPVSR